MMMHSTTDRTALITGSSRGLGRATALRLARDGFRIAVNYRRNRDDAERVVEQIREAGGEAKAFGADVSSVAGVRDLIDQVAGAWGGDGPFLDVLVNNAGTMHTSSFSDTDEAAFDRLFDTNVKGVFFGIQAALPHLRDGGSMILLGTGLTRFSMPQYAAYAASKGAIDVLVRYLAKELGPRGITVNSVAPGATETDMTPYLQNPKAQQQVASLTALGRHGKPEDIVGVISFLTSDDAKWITGQRIEASGGVML